jgi:hypothetical protein
MFRLLFPLVSLVVAPALAATLDCNPSALPPVVHGEGITERTGDLVFNCSGGVPGSTLNVDLYLFLNVDITNRLMSASSNTLTDISFTADNGSGPQTVASTATLTGPGTLVFNGATFTLSSSGSVTLQITGLRGAANQLDFAPGKPMQVSIALNPNTAFSIPTDQVVVGEPEHGLYIAFSGIVLRLGPRCPRTSRASPAFSRPIQLSPQLA